MHEHGAFILGPEVAELERQFTRFVGVGHCVSCANGADALPLALMARGVDSKSLDATIVQARQRSLRPAVVIDVGT